VTRLESLPAREDLIARIEQARDTELLDLAMREVRGRVKPHTWQAFHLLAIERRSGEEVGPVASRSTPGSPTWHGATSNG